MKFRGHHLICLHLFKGEGYSKDFVTHLHMLLKRAENQEEIEVTGTADDICMICPHLRNGICCYKEGANEKIKTMDSKALELLNIREGARVKWKKIRERLPQVFAKWASLYCSDCDWQETCKRNVLWSQLKQGLG